MRLIGLMVVRDEDWIVAASARMALRWCDGLAVYLDRCKDQTTEIFERLLQSPEAKGKDIKIAVDYSPEHWEEMHVRQLNFEHGRALGGTHFAIIDADEILTANLLPSIRPWVEGLLPGDLLELPMLAMRSLDEYQDDATVWSSAYLTLAFADKPDLGWKPRDQNYQHHNRPPHGAGSRIRPLTQKAQGGVMHLQFASPTRLLWKHRWYKMMEIIRWPNRETVAEVDWKYSQALQPPERVSRVPEGWWNAPEKALIRVEHEPWFKAECEHMWRRYGPDKFKGLNLWGFEG